MRILILSKACIVGQYQTKLTSLARQPGVELTVVVPPAWRDDRGTIVLERRHTEGYDLVVAPIQFNGHFHLHYYPTLPGILARARPQILHIDEEPYNLATFLAVRVLQRLDPLARPLFFSWQNLFKRYPPPFAWMERYVLARAAAAIAGSREVQRILQRKGFNKPMPIVPQFGVPESFTPATNRSTARCLVIGYAGRLVPEKGVTVLLQALALIEGPWELHVLGSGPLYDTLLSQARALNIHTHIQFAPWAASELMPRFYQSLDILVVPSLTRPNWKEQFGRVIMEAMACGVPVIGSNSGEIPNVIGDAGLVVSEGDPAALARALDMLMRNLDQRQQFARLGRARALALFSEQRVVDDTYALYQQLLQAPA